MGMTINRPEIRAHFMEVKTDWLEPVVDDDYTLVAAHVDNGDFNKDGTNVVKLKVNMDSSEPEALAWGGLVIFSNLKPRMLYAAVNAGLRYLITSGAISPGDVLDYAGGSDE